MSKITKKIYIEKVYYYGAKFYILISLISTQIKEIGLFIETPVMNEIFYPEKRKKEIQ